MKNMTKPGLTFTTLLLALLLSACGATGGAPTGGGGSAAPAAAANDPAPPAEAASFAESAEDAPPVDPESVIASMSIHMTNNLLALGITPAGSAIGGGVGDFLPHVAHLLEGSAKLGVVSSPDLEAILALQPDYIFTDAHFGGDSLEKLEKIAPVVSTDIDVGTWREHLLETASYVGRESTAEAFIAAYEAKAERVKGLIRDELGEGAKVMAIRVSAKEMRVMSMNRPMGPIMFQDLGLTPIDGLAEMTGEEPYAVISKEVLPDLDADAIFLIVNNDADAKKSFDELARNPVWSHLKAVENGHVYALDGQKWLDYSALGQDMALDDAEALFAKP